jgi:hypothetical protein
VTHLLVQPNYDDNTCPLVSAIIILKPPFLVSIASPLRPPSLNTHATFIYTGRDLLISDSLETVAVSIHIPFSLYLIPHRHTVHSFHSVIASSSSDSSNLSIKSEASREMSPEFDPKATYEACAPLHWDTKEWHF